LHEQKLSEVWGAFSSVENDPNAFEIIYRTYRCFVRRICLRILRDPAEAEDAMQDVFIRLLQKAHTFRGDAAFSSWLYRLTTNVALMRVRRNKAKSNVLAEATATPSAAPAMETSIKPSAYERELVNRMELKSAIHLLPNGCKAAFLLHDLEGYRHREIATICGFTVGNSKSQLHRARIRLRKVLAKR
jgi:RNA polymerase sigma-70 factor, ECF subfamily